MLWIIVLFMLILLEVITTERVKVTGPPDEPKTISISHRHLLAYTRRSQFG